MNSEKNIVYKQKNAYHNGSSRIAMLYSVPLMLVFIYTYVRINVYYK